MRREAGGIALRVDDGASNTRGGCTLSVTLEVTSQTGVGRALRAREEVGMNWPSVFVWLNLKCFTRLRTRTCWYLYLLSSKFIVIQVRTVHYK